MNEATSAIVATLVDEDQRLSVLPHYFGFSQMLAAEASIYDYMTKLSIDYTGGHWHFYRLSNGGFYMAPNMDCPMRVEWWGNGYSGIMTADAAGIVATLFAVNQLASNVRTNKLIDLYHQVRDFAADHPEARAILAAID